MYTLALSLVSDKENLLKEVTTMLSFTHPNVMALIGVCFDEEVPLIIMPIPANHRTKFFWSKSNISLVLLQKNWFF